MVNVKLELSRSIPLCVIKYYIFIYIIYFMVNVPLNDKFVKVRWTSVQLKAGRFYCRLILRA
jgi:hypothetical protein